MMEEDGLPPLEEKKRYTEKLDFENLVFRQIDRINEICLRDPTDPFFIGVDRLASLSLAYGDDALNAEISEINEYFNKKKSESKNVNILKVNSAEKKMDAIMRFLARSGLSGRKRQAKKNI